MAATFVLLVFCVYFGIFHVVEGSIRIPMPTGFVRPRYATCSSLSRLLTIRGGIGKLEKEDDSSKNIDGDKNEDAQSNDEGGEDVNDNGNDDDDDDSNFGGDRNLPMVNTITSIWNKTPPMTQAYVGGSMLITLLSFLLNKNQWPDVLHFKWSSILTGQVWRLATAFLYFGQLDLFYPLTMQFVWQHMAQLEKLNYSKPEEFLVMLVFGAVSLISVYTFLGISTKFLGHNLATFFVYIWSRVFEGSDVNFMDLFTLKSELLPWFFCAQTFFLEREIPFADLIGILVGHVYYYLKQKDVLKAPDRVRMWCQSERMQAKYAAFKSDFE